MSQSAWHLGVVLLGAGVSSRMGTPKLLLAWAGTTVIGHLWRTWQDLGACQVAVVTSPQNTDLDQALNALGISPHTRIINPHPEEGMFSSIQCAARWGGWRKELTHWVISLGDQPHVRRATLAGLWDFAAHHPQQIVQPARQGRARHPVILPRTIFEALALSSAPHLKSFLEGRDEGRVLVESDDMGLDLDLDYPEDYAQALQRFGLSADGAAS